jgi:hypothetical protein
MRYNTYFSRHLKLWRRLRYIFSFTKVFQKKGCIEQINLIIKDIISVFSSNLNLLDCSEYVTSDKNKILFILGSGSSINSLTEKNWSEIGENMSIALNNFLSHSFTANIYSLETGNVPDQYDFNEIYLELLSKKFNSNKIKVLLNYNHLPLNELDRDVFLKDLSKIGVEYQIHKPLNLPTSNSLILRNIMALPNVLIPFNDYRCTVHHGSSLSTAMILGARLGYKKIVLAGFDLNDSNYFFYTQKDFVSKRLTDLYQSILGKDLDKPHIQTQKSHTNSFSSVTTVEFIEVFKKTLGKKYGVKLYISNPKSLLAEQLEVYNFKND